MDNEFTRRPYKAEDGIALLETMPGGLKGYPDAEKWCKEAEEDGMAFTVLLGDKVVCSAGIIKEREGVGNAWALYPPDIGSYHIDPRIVKDKMKELMAKNNIWRLGATARADFPAAHSYLRYLGFEKEGVMRCNEPDKTDSILYSIVDKCRRCGKCCYLAYFDDVKIVRTSKKCPHLTADNLCSVYDHRPDWCMTAEQMAKLNLLPEGCGYKGDM